MTSSVSFEPKLEASPTTAGGQCSPPATGVPRSSPLRQWAGLVAVTSVAQVGVQVIGFACGIWIIRCLSVQQYAWYTLANTMLATMTMLADGGIASGVMSQGGKVWQDKTELGRVIASGIHLRRRFGIVAIVALMPVLIYLLVTNDCPVAESVFIPLAMIPAFAAALTGNLLQIGPKLNQDVASLQRIEVSSNVVRLLLNTVTLAVFPFAMLAIFLTGLSQVYANLRLRRLSSQHATLAQSPDPAHASEIKAVVRRILPNTIYYCLSGQIMIWIVSLLGNPESIAKIGALGRISVLLSIFVSVLATLVVPRFARMSSEDRNISKRFYQIIFGMFVLTGVLNGMAWMFPTAFLLLLGEKYNGLDILLRWSLATATLGTLNQVASHLMNSRGLIMPPLAFILFSIIVQILALWSQDLTRLEGVFLAAIIPAASTFILRLTYFFVRFKDLARNS